MAPGKRPFDIGVVLRRVRAAVAGFADAAMFALADEGHGTVFEQVVACVISVRTRDEVMIEAARRLFAEARTPEALARLGPERIDALIRPATFHGGKARQLHAIAVRARDAHGGALPCDLETLLSLPGVGPKCASLALGIACGEPHIGVDVHVHRVVNRWGYVRASTPEGTQAALMAKLPRRYWIEINRLLVPFGKHVCTRARPHCTTCPVLAYCRQVGVTAPR